MCQNCLVKTIHHAQHHFGWDNSLSPVLHVASGSQLEFHCTDAANGWFNASSTAADIPTLPFDKLNPVSGPVYVEGAQPGDALKVTLESFRPSGFGWTANIPGFGLLADQFSDPALALWQYDRQGLTPAPLADMAAYRWETLRRYPRRRSRRRGPSFGGAAAPRGRQSGYSRSGRWLHYGYR